MPTWRYDQVAWGVTECARKRCSRPAACLFEGEPLCLEDADDALERVAAIEINRRAAELLPDWRE